MDKIYFTVNGEHYSLSGSEVSPETSLNEYLRNYLKLQGTKAMCHEGGCGACVVAVSRAHPAAREKRVLAVNSCLVHVLSCHEWDITTIEGVGSRKDGYHPLQSRLAAFNGTQCGYCTPGWLMNMYSLYTSTKKLSTQQVEKSFGGNMCRCTGYRPILDAFKTFAVDTDPALSDKLQDMEDLHDMKCNKQCSRSSSLGDEWCVIEDRRGSLLTMQLRGNRSRWYKAFSIKDVFTVLKKEGINDYRLVAGNTGKGVYPLTSQPRVQIDISSIESLKQSHRDENLVLGAGVTLAEMMQQCSKWTSSNDFQYLMELAAHLELVAHVPVRNIGTIGGNLAMKNKHRGFPSDVFLLLETVQATVSIGNSALERKDVKMQDFLKEDLTNKLILDVKLPPLSASNLIKTYKIMPRAQNAHAIVNAGFLFKVDSSNKVVTSNIVFGGISPDFIRARGTESVLRGLPLFSEDALQKALGKLDEELVPVDQPPDPSPFCRKTLAMGLFYKAILSLSPNVAPRYLSGATLLERGVSRGTQSFDTDKSLWPLNKPIPKLEALTQCAGEVKYACDIDSSPRAVHLAYVLSTVCVADIDGFDASEALKIPGVVAFFTAKDIPGKNCFTPKDVPWQQFEEEILASKRTLYYGQPVGLIAAVTHTLALNAAELVKVKYKESGAKPVLTISDALGAPDKEKRIREEVKIIATDKGENTTHVIKGSYSVPSQYHYTMETQCSTAVCTERGVAVRTSSQWLDLAHAAVAQALALQQHCVEVSVERVGGAYGGKASRAAQAACCAALAARALGRRAALVLPLAHNMAAVGKRAAADFHYEIGVDDDGLIQYLNLTYYSDCGCCYNDTSGAEIAGTLTNLYSSSRWNIKGYSVLTDKASNTWCRAPSTTEATAVIEHIMERIAQTTHKDPVATRILHIAPEHNALKNLISTFKYDSKYSERKVEIDKFNAENAWKKRGLKLSIMSYPIGYSGNFPVTISVYHTDGSVAISHGGIEMGQGINTKVAQVCAYTLKIPLEMVTVLGSNSFVSPNAMASNGSITSECVAHAARRACDDLLQRLAPVRHAMQEPTWKEVVKGAFDKGINLQASYMTSPADALVGYSVYGACAAEVELDVLSGCHALRRVDLLEDTGVSLSPDVDVGQVEGAFIMGLGLWTSEQLVYSRETGQLLTDSTWTYKPPGARDVPEDFRVSFTRNTANTAGVLRSKATGEPALTLAVSVTHALHAAILEARKEFGRQDTDWVHVDTPYSVENILQAISYKKEYFKLK